MNNSLVAQVENASTRIRSYARLTELQESSELSIELKARIFFKWENHQPTGSFKIRGTANKILAHLSDCREQGVAAASTGNHGLATAYVCHREGLKLALFIPSSISEVKRKKLEMSEATLVLVPGSCELAEARARQEAEEAGKVFVSPYNDEEVIAGQGTCGLEIMTAFPDVDEVIVPVGGGGLISGIAVYLKEKKPGIKVTGIEPENSAFINHSLSLGYLSNDFPEKPTIADAVAGGLEEGAITFDLIRRYVDRVLTVDEESIISAMKLIYRKHGEKVEGAGALPLAGLLSFPELFEAKKIVAVVSGGNVDENTWEKISFSKKYL